MFQNTVLMSWMIRVKWDCKKLIKINWKGNQVIFSKLKEKLFNSAALYHVDGVILYFQYINFVEMGRRENNLELPYSFYVIFSLFFVNWMKQGLETLLEMINHCLIFMKQRLFMCLKHSHLVRLTKHQARILSKFWLSI